MVRLFVRLSDLLERVSEIVAIGATIVMVLALFLQIVSRYFFNQTFVWTEEVALLMFTWIILLGGALGIKQKFHARLALAASVTGKWGKATLERLSDILAILFGAVLVKSGYAYFIATQGSYSAAVEYPLEFLYASVPVTGLLILVHGIAALISPVSYGEEISV